MRPSPITALFESPPAARRGPSGVVISVSAHVLACGMIYLALRHGYRLSAPVPTQHYLVRTMDLLHDPSRPEMAVSHEQAARGRSSQPAVEEAVSAPERLAMARVPVDATIRQKARITLVQPDVPKDAVVIKATALPQVMLWSRTDRRISVVVPAPPHLSATNMVASLDLPNQEMHIADLRLSATPFRSPAPLPSPSNTSPVSLPSPVQAQSISQSLARHADQPTPTAILSASMVQLENGPTVLPLVSEIAPAPATGSLQPGSAKSVAHEGSGVAHESAGAAGGKTTGARGESTQSGRGSHRKLGIAGDGGSNSDGRLETNGEGKSGSHGTVAVGGFSVLGEDKQDDALADGVPAAQPPTVTHVALPKNGAFSMVVVGDSPADDYPEAANLWRGRLAYTVYLQVGTPQKWILQYAVASSDTAALPAPGKLDAPWPYDIARPSLDADAASDAIMVHGFVNAAGRFEGLAVIFPEELGEAAFVLRALELWQFRPALRNGQPAMVEVLLIIPAAE